MKNLTYLKNGKPVSNTLVISDVFESSHHVIKQNLVNLENSGHLESGVDFWPVSLSSASDKSIPAFELSERGFMIALPFLVGRKSRQAQAMLVEAYFSLREQLGIRTVKVSETIQ